MTCLCEMDVDQSREGVPLSGSTALPPRQELTSGVQTELVVQGSRLVSSCPLACLHLRSRFSLPSSWRFMSYQCPGAEVAMPCAGADVRAGGAGVWAHLLRALLRACGRLRRGPGTPTLSFARMPATCAVLAFGAGLGGVALHSHALLVMLAWPARL